MTIKKIISLYLKNKGGKFHGNSVFKKENTRYKEKNISNRSLNHHFANRHRASDEQKLFYSLHTEWFAEAKKKNPKTIHKDKLMCNSN